MSLLHELIQKLKQMNSYSKMSIKLGFYIMIIFYILAIASRLLAPAVPDFFRAMSFCYGCLEAAPATFAAGFIAAVLCEMMLSHYGGDGSFPDKK